MTYVKRCANRKTVRLENEHNSKMDLLALVAMVILVGVVVDFVFECLA
jgi:hypothetical protein